MRVIDTSTWIEWLIGSPLADDVDKELPAPDTWVVPTIVQFALCKWLTRELGEERSDQVMAFTMTCVVAPMTTRIALYAAALGAQSKLSAADAIVYATAQLFDADLVTCDAHFARLPGVVWLPKQADH